MNKTEGGYDSYPVGLHECPNCGSEMVEGGFIEVVTDDAQQKMSCGNCGATWYAVFGYLFWNGLEIDE